MDALSSTSFNNARHPLAQGNAFEGQINAFTGPSGSRHHVCLRDQSVNSTHGLFKTESGSYSVWGQPGKSLSARNGAMSPSGSEVKPASGFPYVMIQEELCKLTAQRRSLDDYLKSLSNHSAVDGGQSAKIMRDGLQKFPLVMKELGVSEGVSIQVEGAQNAGKTSLIKALTGVEGEIHGKMATRGRTLLQMIHNPDTDFEGSLYFQGEENEVVHLQDRDDFNNAVLKLQRKLPANKVSEKLLIQCMEGREFPTLTLVDNPGYNALVHGAGSDFFTGDESGRRVRMLVANGEGSIAGYPGYKDFLEDQQAIKIIVVTHANGCVEEQKGSLIAGERNNLFVSGHHDGIPMFAVDCSFESINEERESLKSGNPSRVLIDKLHGEFVDLQAKWKQEHSEPIVFNEAQFSTSALLKTLQHVQSTMEEVELVTINPRLEIMHQQSVDQCEMNWQRCKEANQQFYRKELEGLDKPEILRNGLMLDTEHHEEFSKKLHQSSLECYSVLPRIRHEVRNVESLKEKFEALKKQDFVPDDLKSPKHRRAGQGAEEHLVEEPEIVDSCKDFVSEGFDEHMDDFGDALRKHTSTVGNDRAIHGLKIRHENLQQDFNKALRSRLANKLCAHVVEYFNGVIDDFEGNFPGAHHFFEKCGEQKLKDVKSTLKTQVQSDVRSKLREIEAGHYDLCDIKEKTLKEETAIYMKVVENIFSGGQIYVADGDQAMSLIKLLKAHKGELIKAAVITGGLVTVGGLVVTTGAVGAATAAAVAVPAGMIVVKDKELRNQAVKTGGQGVKAIKEGASSLVKKLTKSGHSGACDTIRPVAHEPRMRYYNKDDLCKALAEVGLSSEIIAKESHDDILSRFVPFCCIRLQEKLEDLMFDCKTDIELGRYQYENSPIQKMQESEALKEQVELAQAYFREIVAPTA